MKPVWHPSSGFLSQLAFCSSLFILACSGTGAHHSADAASPEGPSSEPVDAIDHDALFVVNGGDSTISVIDTGTNEVVSTIELSDASFPHHLYLSPEAYVSNQMEATVSVIDVASASVVATVDVGVKPNGLAWRAN